MWPQFVGRSETEVMEDGGNLPDVETRDNSRRLSRQNREARKALSTRARSVPASHPRTDSVALLSPGDGYTVRRKVTIL